VKGFEHMVTDVLVVLLLLSFFALGFRNGLLHTIIGPVSFILGIIIATVYYFKTGHVINSLIISIVAPFIIRIFISILLKRKKKKEKERDLPTASRLFGGIFKLAWNSIYIFIILILIALIPPKYSWSKNINKDIMSSKIYAMIAGWAGNVIPTSSSDMAEVTSMLQDPEKREKLEKTKAFKDLMGNDKFTDVTEDKEIIEQIQNKSFVALMSNPKIQELMSDPQVVKQIIALNEQMLKQK